MNLNHPVGYSPDKYQIQHKRGHSAQEFSNNKFNEVSCLIFVKIFKIFIIIL